MSFSFKAESLAPKKEKKKIPTFYSPANGPAYEVTTSPSLPGAPCAQRSSPLTAEGNKETPLWNSTALLLEVGGPCQQRGH